MKNTGLVNKSWCIIDQDEQSKDEKGEKRMNSGFWAYESVFYQIYPLDFVEHHLRTMVCRHIRLRRWRNGFHI